MIRFNANRNNALW